MLVGLETPRTLSPELQRGTLNLAMGDPARRRSLPKKPRAIETELVRLKCQRRRPCVDDQRPRRLLLPIAVARAKATPSVAQLRRGRCTQGRPEMRGRVS